MRADGTTTRGEKGKPCEIEDVGVLYFSEANVFSSVLPNDWWKKADLCNASRNVTVT